MSPAHRMLGAAAALSLLGATAHAREFTAGQFHVIEDIHRDANNDPVLWRMAQQGDPTCGAYAINEAFRLSMSGFSKDGITIGIVIAPGHQGADHTKIYNHALVEVHAEINGKPVVYVLDSLQHDVRTREELEALGYAWIEEFKL